MVMDVGVRASLASMCWVLDRYSFSPTLTWKHKSVINKQSKPKIKVKKATKEKWNYLILITYRWIRVRVSRDERPQEPPYFWTKIEPDKVNWNRFKNWVKCIQMSKCLTFTAQVRWQSWAVWSSGVHVSQRGAFSWDSCLIRSLLRLPLLLSHSSFEVVNIICSTRWKLLSLSRELD